MGTTSVASIVTVEVSKGQSYITNAATSHTAWQLDRYNTSPAQDARLL